MGSRRSTRQEGRLWAVLELVRRRPGIAVAAAFVLTAGYLAAQASRVDDYIWMIDELLYAKVAQSFADGELFRAEVYGQSVGLPNALYPRLLAPLYAVFGSIGAFEAAHLLDAVLYASVIVPVYLLARRLSVPWWLALIAGLVAAWTPWAVATTVLMTESLAYPAFAWAALAVAAAFDEPRPRTHALALLAIGIAAYARVQFVLLLPIFVASVVLQALAADNADRRARRQAIRIRERLRPHAPLGWMVAALAVVLVIISAADGSLIGTYDVATDQMRFPPGWLDSASWHLAHIVVGVGVIPVILWLAWLARAAVSPRTGVELGFAIFSGLTVATLVYTAGDFAQNVAGGAIQERYLFYIVPLFLVGAVALLSDRREPAPALSLVAAAVLLTAVIGVPDYNPAAGGDGFAIVAAAFTGFVRVVEGRTSGLRELWPGDRLATDEMLVLFTILAALALVVLLRMRSRTIVAPAILIALLAYTAAETHYLLGRAIPSIDAAWQRLPGEASTPRDWIDRALPEGARAGVLEAPVLAPPGADGRELFLRAQFWNETVQASFVTAERGNLTGLPAAVLEIDEDSGRVASSVPEVPYLLVSATDPEFRLRGEVVARAAYGLELLRAERPYRVAWSANGGFGDGYTKAAQERRLVVHPDGASLLAFTVTAPAEAKRSVAFDVRVGDRTRTWRLDPGEPRQMRLRLEPGVGEVGVRARSGTDLADGRQVGVLVDGVELR